MTKFSWNYHICREGSVSNLWVITLWDKIAKFGASNYDDSIVLLFTIQLIIHWSIEARQIRLFQKPRPTFLNMSTGPHLSTSPISTGKGDGEKKKLWEKSGGVVLEIEERPWKAFEEILLLVSRPHGHPKGLSPHNRFSSILQQDPSWPINKLMPCCRVFFFFP